MSGYPERVEALIKSLTRLPGIGRRSAERIALYLLKEKPNEVFELADLIGRAKRETQFCTLCGNFSAESRCTICQDEHRDNKTICVVQEPRDISRIEHAGRYQGVYHVLFGAISPLDGIGPAELRISELEQRIRKGVVEEVVIATATNTDGETTASYLAERLKPLGVHLTRIARGLPVGASLEFADAETIGSALEHRQVM